MSTLEVGAGRIPTLTVDPFDDTTNATLRLIAADSTVTTPTATPADAGNHWTGDVYEFTLPGEWIEEWTVTGTGRGTTRVVLLVAPAPDDVPTGQRVYATTADYAKALRKAPPANSRLALAQASAAVDDMLLTAVYNVDADGMPVDAAVIKALRDATCAQAEDARTNAINGAQSFTIGSVSVTQAAASKVRAEDYRSPRAQQVLQRAGLLGTEPWTW